MKKIASLILIVVSFIVIGMLHTIRAQNATDYDVIVVGGGTGGVGASIQAARLGARVLLIEETDWLGGQMTAAGVSTMDGSPDIANSGIYKEFIDRVRNYYSTRGKSLNTCYWSTNSICFEPLVGKTILQSMISEAPAITVSYKTRVTGVVKNGNTIGGVTTQDGKTYTGKIVIDATEYGDIIPMTGEQYRIGNLVL